MKNIAIRTLLDAAAKGELSVCGLENKFNRSLLSSDKIRYISEEDK